MSEAASIYAQIKDSEADRDALYRSLLAEIAARRSRGASLSKLGAEMGISHQAVQQMIARRKS